jgi:hypothetical protein
MAIRPQTDRETQQRIVEGTFTVGRHLEIQRFFYDKSVCLVGGANWADDFKWDQLRKYDIVFQLNHHMLRRTHQPVDIMFIGDSVPVDISYIERFKLKLVGTNLNKPKGLEFYNYCITHNIHYQPYDLSAYGKTNPQCPQHEWVNALCQTLGTLPLTGILAIAYLLSLPIREAYITGFDFYAQPNGARRKSIGPHLLDVQSRWLINRWWQDYRINLCDRTAQSLRIKNTNYDRLEALQETA